MKSAFDAVLMLDSLLDEAAKMHELKLAKAMGVSRTYARDIVERRRKLNPRTLDLVMDVLKIPDSQRVLFHLAGARSRGWRV